MSNLTNVQCQHGAGKHRETEKLYKASAEVTQEFTPQSAGTTECLSQSQGLVLNQSSTEERITATCYFIAKSLLWEMALIQCENGSLIAI